RPQRSQRLPYTTLFRSLQGAAEDRGLLSAERGGRQRRRDRSERDQSPRGNGAAGGEGRAGRRAGRLDRVEHADRAGLPGAARRGEEEDTPEVRRLPDRV